MPGSAKAVGKRGSWFATVDGERLPCVHEYWVKRMHHSDPGYLENDQKWAELVDTIKSARKVILTKDRPIVLPEKKSGFGFEREGYIAIFEVDNIVADENGLNFDLVKRVLDLR